MQKIIVLLVWFCQLGVNLDAQEETTLLQDTGEIPFEFVKNKIIIPVSIDGSTYQFILDTGGVLGVSNKVKNAKQLAEIDKLTVSDINKNKIAISTVLVPQISIGNWTFTAKKAFIDDLTEKYPSSCYETDGMIGRDFFEDAILQFDYSRKVLRLSKNRNAFKLDENKRTPLKVAENGLPKVALKINQKEEFLVFDSGSADFFSYKTATAKKTKRKNKQEKLIFEGIFSYGITMDNPKIDKRYRLKVDQLDIAGTTFENFYTDFSKATQSRIGAAILYHGVVTIDYKQKWFYFEPFSGKEKATFLEIFEFDMAKIGTDYIVKWVLKNSSAEKAGLQSGDRIISINGKALEEDCEGYLNGYSFYALKKVDLEIQDKEGKTRLISLEKQRFN